MKPSNFLRAVLRRFVRVFASGAVAQLTIVLSRPEAELLENIEQLPSILAVAALAGGIAALDKYLRYEDDHDKGNS